MVTNPLREENSGKAVVEGPSCMAPFQLLLNVLIDEKPLQHGLMYAPMKVNGKEVLTLLDTGTTHNFVIESRVADLGLKVAKSTCQVKALNTPSTTGWWSNYNNAESGEMGRPM